MAPKPIADFPRPPDDNGRGVHWSASVYHPSGPSLHEWMRKLQALQIKWVKVLDDSGGSSIELCRALIDSGIMPVVRLFRERPNPDRMGGREVDAVRRLVQAGARYFESNNEPDLPAEWQNSHMPANWLDIVVDNFIWDADLILKEGGLPALPPMGPGSKDNVIGMVVQRGRKDIFERGGWVAIHNYTLNHPLDYPDDPVNQRGEPLTPAAYAELARWQYSHLDPAEAGLRGVTRSDYDKFQGWAWDNRNIQMVNELRAQSSNPGDTIREDPNCFRGYEWFGQDIFAALGFHVPVISTEGGPVVGWGDDKRYAKMNPATQAAYQMEIFRFLQDEAPPWYFSCCTWLIASLPLGDFNPTWDQMSWFTHAWDLQFGLSGELPLLAMMRNTPARVRWELRSDDDDQPDDDVVPPLIDRGVIGGKITAADGAAVAGVALALHDGQKEAAATVSAADGSYQLTASPGRYDLVARWYGPVAHDLSLDPGEQITFDLPDFPAAGQFSILGVVKSADGPGRAGVQVSLQRNGVIHATAVTGTDGSFAFAPALAGAYAVAVNGAAASASVDPGQPQATVQLLLPGGGEKRYHLSEKRLLTRAETENKRMFYGRVRNAAGQGIKDVELEMRWTNPEPGAHFPRTRTGRDPFKPDPDGYYEFLHSPGEFAISVVQGDFPSDTATGLLTAGILGREGDPITYEVNFELRTTETPVGASSVVRGSIPGGRVGQMMRLWSGGVQREFLLENSREFRFDGLSAGLYALELTGVGLIRPEIVLDGSAEMTLDFPLLGAIVGQVLAPTRNSIALISETYGFTRHAQLSQEGHYRFTNLPAGLYRLELGQMMLSGLRGDGQSVLSAPLIDLTQPTEPRASTLTGLVHDEQARPLRGIVVTLLRDGQALASAATDAEGRFTFTDLAAGLYALAIADAVQAEALQLDGVQMLAVDLTYTPPPLPPTKPLARYYLLAPADRALRPALMRLAAPWLAKQPPGVVGFSQIEAAEAAEIILLGDGVSTAEMAALREGGSQVLAHPLDLIALAAFLQ